MDPRSTTGRDVYLTMLALTIACCWVACLGAVAQC